MIPKEIEDVLVAKAIVETLEAAIPKGNENTEEFVTLQRLLTIAQHKLAQVRRKFLAEQLELAPLLCSLYFPEDGEKK